MLDSEKIRNIEKDERAVKNKEDKKEIKEKCKRVISLTFIQCIIGLMLVLSLIIIKYANSEIYEKITDVYKSSPYFMLKEEDGIIIIE